MGEGEFAVEEETEKYTFHPKFVFDAMGKPDSGCPGSRWRTSPLSISMSIVSLPKIFGVGLVQHWKEIFFVSEISAGPPETPLWGQRGFP